MKSSSVPVDAICNATRYLGLSADIYMGLFDSSKYVNSMDRRFNEQVRLRFDQSVVIAGLVSDSQVRTIAGLAGFINVPFIGPLFSRNTHSDDQSETLVILKPRLVSLPPSETRTSAIWTGTETKPRPVL